MYYFIISGLITTIIIFIFQLGVNINTQNKNGETALILAAETGNKTIASLLIQKGVNLNLKDKDGNTGLKINV